jgi:hypothetical protein
MIIANLLGALITCALLLQSETPKTVEEGFESLFDGKTLKGWYGPTDGYEVKDGSITAQSGRGGTIYTRRSYSDFVVRFEFKLPPGGDSGIALRYPGSGHPAYVGMCEIQIQDSSNEKFKDTDPRTRNGAAYGLVAPKLDALRPNDWNSEEITVRGSTIKVLLNGQTILDTDLSEVSQFLNDHPHPGKDRESGHFGITGDTDPVQFRNIRIKKLKS